MTRATAAFRKLIDTLECAVDIYDECPEHRSEIDEVILLAEHYLRMGLDTLSSPEPEPECHARLH